MVHFATIVAHSCIGGADKQQKQRHLLIAISAIHFHHLQTLSDESTRSFSNIIEWEAAFLRSTLIFQHITVVTGNEKGSHRHTGAMCCFPLQRTDFPTYHGHYGKRSLVAILERHAAFPCSALDFSRTSQSLPST